MTTDETIILNNLICMLYHEARNVRHPIKRGLLSNEDATRFAQLKTLPHNRCEAWRQMTTLRNSNLGRCNLEEVYRKTYRATIDDLIELFERTVWRNSSEGGNKWAIIARKVRCSLDAHLARNFQLRNQLIKKILLSRHNTGTVCEKLKKLKDKCNG